MIKLERNLNDRTYTGVNHMIDLTLDEEPQQLEVKKENLEHSTGNLLSLIVLQIT